MEKDHLAVLHKKVEIPGGFQEKMDTALAQVRAESSAVKFSAKKGGRKKNKIAKVAAIVCACILIPGATVTAAGMINSYWQRMAEMDDGEVEHYYEVAVSAETMLFNRRYTEEEKRRMEELEQKYRAGEIVPHGEIRLLAEGESYDGEGVAFEEAACKTYLPDRTVTDEELLQIIELGERMSYSIMEVNQIGYGTKWRARMEKMTAEEVDEVYFILYSSWNAFCGGYSRELTEKEEARYAELLAEYEENGLYTRAVCTVVERVEDCPKEELSICIQDGDYHLPERELTDEELLLIIDWQHKGMYCIERIHKELYMGIRDHYPESPYRLGATEETQEPPAQGISQEERAYYDALYAKDGISGIYDYANGGGTILIAGEEDETFTVSIHLFRNLEIENCAGRYEDGILSLSGTDEHGGDFEIEITFSDGAASLNVLYSRAMGYSVIIDGWERQ